VIVVRQQRHGEHRLAMVAEIGRDVADPQPAIGRGVVVVRRDLRLERDGMAKVPPLVLGEDRPGVISRMKIKRVNAVAVGGGIAGRSDSARS